MVIGLDLNLEVQPYAFCGDQSAVQVLRQPMISGHTRLGNHFPSSHSRSAGDLHGAEYRPSHAVGNYPINMATEHLLTALAGCRLQGEKDDGVPCHGDPRTLPRADAPKRLVGKSALWLALPDDGALGARLIIHSAHLRRRFVSKQAQFRRLYGGNPAWRRADKEISMTNIKAAESVRGPLPRLAPSAANIAPGRRRP